MKFNRNEMTQPRDPMKLNILHKESIVEKHGTKTWCAPSDRLLAMHGEKETMSPKGLDFKHFHSPHRDSSAWLAPLTETRKSQFLSRVTFAVFGVIFIVALSVHPAAATAIFVDDRTDIITLYVDGVIVATADENFATPASGAPGVTTGYLIFHNSAYPELNRPLFIRFTDGIVVDGIGENSDFLALGVSVVCGVVGVCSPGSETFTVVGLVFTSDAGPNAGATGKEEPFPIAGICDQVDQCIVETDTAIHTVYSQVGSDGSTLTVQYANDAEAVSTPEPSTLYLLATGLVGLLGYGWRRRK